MIIVRVPLRASLLGGGSDIPDYFTSRTGLVLGFALRKYIYLSINDLPESRDILLKYSKTEKVQTIEQIEHPVFRACLEKYSLSGIDISVSADIPSGSGLGSSSAFTVGLLALLRTYLGIPWSKVALAEEACEIEIEILGERIGKQDQYLTSVGGINELRFQPNGFVGVTQFNGTELANWIESFGVFVRHKGAGARSASGVIKKQISNDQWFSKIDQIRTIAQTFLANSKPSLEELLDSINLSWTIKRTMTTNTSVESIDQHFDFLFSKGAYAVRLLGAGESGYLLAFGDHTFQTELEHSGTSHIFPAQIDYEGVSVIYDDRRLP